MPHEVQQAFLARRLDSITGKEPVAVSIRRIAAQFPEVEIREHSLRRIARGIPRSQQMGREEWRKNFLPQGRWEAPHANHTHTFDFTRADIWVWDRDPDEEPYRPWFTHIIDERSRSSMWGLYTKEAPSTAVLQSVLLHAWMPKDDPKWPQCGAPRFLHCDNGKVQDSRWLEDVCRTLSVDLDLLQDINHTAVYSGFQQGKVERSFGIIHSMFEHGLGIAYCGSSPGRRPEDCPGKSGGPKAWAQYPTLESLNYGWRVWVPAEYHALRHRELRMSRLDRWLADMRENPELLRIPDRDYLETALLQRGGARQVRRSEISLMGMTYWHDVLQGYEGTPVELRWDPSDLDRVLVLDREGQAICWAERRRVRTIGNPKDLAEWRDDRRRAKERKRLIERATEAIAPTDEGTFQRTMQALEQAHRDQVIPFRPQAKPVAPTPPPTTEDVLEMFAAADDEAPAKPDDERIVMYGIEI